MANGDLVGRDVETVGDDRRMNSAGKTRSSVHSTNRVVTSGQAAISARCAAFEWFRPPVALAALRWPVRPSSQPSRRFVLLPEPTRSRQTASDLTLGSPYGIRTRAATLRGWCPRPLDERAVLPGAGAPCGPPRYQRGWPMSWGERNRTPNYRTRICCVASYTTPHRSDRAVYRSDDRWVSEGTVPSPRHPSVAVDAGHRRSKPMIRPRATAPASAR